MLLLHVFKDQNKILNLLIYNTSYGQSYGQNCEKSLKCKRAEISKGNSVSFVVFGYDILK